MAIFNSYVSLPEGIFDGVDKAVGGFQVQSYGSAQTAPKSEATWWKFPAGFVAKTQKINGCFGCFGCFWLCKNETA